METFFTLLVVCEGNPPVSGDFPHKGQWRGALASSLICAWTNGWANNRDAGDLRRRYDALIMTSLPCVIVVCWRCYNGSARRRNWDWLWRHDMEVRVSVTRWFLSRKGQVMLWWLIYCQHKKTVGQKNRVVGDLRRISTRWRHDMQTNSAFCEGKNQSSMIWYTLKWYTRNIQGF